MSCHHHRPNQNSSYPEQNYGPGAKWIKNLTRDRLNNFNGGHFSDVNLTSMLFTHRVDNAEHVKLQVWSAPGLTKPTFEEAMKQKFKPAKKGDSFGPSWTNHWWKVSVVIPGYWQQYERVQFEFDPGCEAMIYSVDGTPLQGITGGYGGDRRVEYIIPMEAREKGTHDFVIESTCNGMFGVPWNGDTIAPPDMNRYFSLASADLVVPNQEAWHLLWDFTTLREICDALPGNTTLQNKALVAANEIMNTLQSGDASSIRKCRQIAEGVLGEGWQSKAEDIYQDPDNAQIWGIGHCHIDTAWLWPYRVTQQKVARSWSTQVDLMERYPEHRFACSQAQQYKWLEQLYPPLFERVKEKILEGKFHPVGGSWVENDSNMPSGEALVRQFVFGQRYFEEKFGKRCDTAWLPDSFGLTGAYPQLIRGAGMKYFFTQKLSCNVFPHSTFNWVGIDGTQVLCHMTPVDTYTAQATAGDVNKGLANHKNIESSNTSLLVFGNGDGGGGPLPKMLENLRRIRAANNNHRELPPINMGRSVDQFFEHLEKKSEQGKKLPNWHGELYLEFHRGTYTSHGSIKKGNRHSEVLLLVLENAATVASMLDSEYVYPKQQIDELWEKVLLNQCVGMVYDDAELLYAEVNKEGNRLIDEALKVVYPDSAPFTPITKLRPDTRLSDIVAFNPTPFPRREVIKLPISGISPGLRSAVAQVDPDGRFGYALMNNGALDSTVHNSIGSLHASVFTNGSDHFVLRNSSVQMTISGGRITSLLDVALGRELIPEGMTGGLVIFEDRPNYWDAWDVEIHHLETARQLEFTNISVVAHGPLRASVRAEVKYGKSSIVVMVSKTASQASVSPTSRSLFRFDAKVDWHQRHEFLKFEIPLNIHSDNATYETQFGWVQRPTHKNTTWDMAKFEVCGHKYADLSEYGYGVAILSESKYGFSCRGNVLRISLLRAATAPDAEQDQGKHEFSWAVMPHLGHFLQSDVPMAGILFNIHNQYRYLTKSRDQSLQSGLSRLGVDGAPNVFMETIKRGEHDAFDPESSGPMSVVLRLYEAYGGHAQATLKLGDIDDIEKVYLTNLLEDEESQLQLVETDQKNVFGVKLQFRGFEVKTVKIVLNKEAIFGRKGGKRSSWVDIDGTKLTYH
ncbi:glycoside hydrolase family 38 protein [Moniliophthora roreri MCA 2997]|uniref:alpha-mannosidase n=1 Tax=Moniliophthora roreri (strain MCA 2997) TaxID=1381753 RepID=V2XC52_MONRO|nr:glycoside hydrolase family 38 protein [Moniliophthora roreri MCA 2997]